jgi:hypothetical protein
MHGSWSLRMGLARVVMFRHTGYLQFDASEKPVPAAGRRFGSPGPEAVRDLRR